MCIVKKLFNCHITPHDKLDLTMVIVVYADLIWCLGEMVYNPIHFYHYFVLTGLTLGSILSTIILIEIIKRHHRQWSKRHERIIEARVTQQSET